MACSNVEVSPLSITCDCGEGEEGGGEEREGKGREGEGRGGEGGGERGGEGRGGEGRGEVYTCCEYRNCYPQIDATMS